MEKNTFNFGINLPILDIRSRYNLKGKILVLPLVGHGAAELVLKDVRTNVTTEISFPRVEDREIFQVDSMNVKFVVHGIKVKFENLFNGNKVLGKVILVVSYMSGSEVKKCKCQNCRKQNCFINVFNKLQAIYEM